MCIGREEFGFYMSVRYAHINVLLNTSHVDICSILCIQFVV